MGYQYYRKVFQKGLQSFIVLILLDISFNNTISIGVMYEFEIEINTYMYFKKKFMNVVNELQL